MQRSKKVVFVAHCILNVNSKVKGIANYNSSIKELLNYFMENDYGIVQLPCPELLYSGLKRFGMSKEQYDNPCYRDLCQKLAKDIVNQMIIYQNEKYDVIGLYGIDGSPTCGINQSCRGYQGGCIEMDEVGSEYLSDEKGIFMEEIDKLIKEHHLEITYYAIKEANLEEVH